MLSPRINAATDIHQVLMSSQLARLPQDTYEKKRLTKTLDGNSGQQLNRSRKLRGGRKIRAVLDFYFFEILNGSAQRGKIFSQLRQVFYFIDYELR